MKHSLIILMALAASAAQAQGFAPLSLADSGETCYTWEGGHKSAGSFSKCSPTVYTKPAPRVVAALPAPVQPSPVMMPMSAPVTCAPPPKPVVKKKRPAPKKC